MPKALRKYKKIKLLDLLIKTNPSLEREKAFAYILSGNIKVDGGIIRDPKLMVREDATIEWLIAKYVSRGGLKLEAAISRFAIDCNNKTVLDAGSSTGGFTDCLLQHGAKSVYSVDVGYNQLHISLRQDPRVVVMEETNIKDVQALTPKPDFAVADLSFRSILPVLQHLFDLTKEKKIVILLKPQFEVNAEEIPDFDGIVRDPKIHLAVATQFYQTVTKMGYIILGACPSPILGGHGNKEFLIYLAYSNESSEPKASIGFDRYLKELTLK